MDFLKLSVLLPSLLFPLQFTQMPTLTSAGAGQWQAAFAVDETTDVEVSIVDTRDSTVIRHLAAGMLGAKAPLPLQVSSLSQTLAWDGADDFGKAVAQPEAMSVRVRAGMTPRLVNLAGENLYDNNGTPSIVTDPAGNRYVLNNSTGQTPFIRMYNISGQYMKTLFPPPANLPPDSVKSYRINVLPGGGWVPKTYPVVGFGVHFTGLELRGATLVGFQNGRIMVSGKSGSHYIDTNGCFTDTAPNPVGATMKASANARSFTPAKGLAAFHEGPFVFERIAVDRRNDCVFWNGNRYISDWTARTIHTLPVGLDNITVGPDGRFLYGYNIDGQSIYGNAFVKRYSRTTFAAVPYGASGSNRVTGQLYYEFGYAGVPGNHRGMAVGWQGQVAACTEASFCFQVPDTNGTVTSGSWDSPPVGSHVKLLTMDPAADKNYAREGLMGVKYDPAGNFYLGLRKRAARPILPAPAFATDRAFLNSGGVVKFHRDSSGFFNPVSAALRGHSFIYPQPFGPFTMQSAGWDHLNLGDAACTCRSTYFDVDPYGRLYIPNGVACKVYIADNAGNTIKVFGEYGNTDSRGGLPGPGTGVTYDAPAIPMAWPSSVGASEDYVYVTDLVNARLVRVQMVYAIDNYPGLTDRGTGVAADLFGVPTRGTPTLAAAPNPFNPDTRILVTLPAVSHIDLKIYDLSGRLVRTLATTTLPAGAHAFTWNARDGADRNVAAGMYVAVLRHGHGAQRLKLVLAR